MTGETNLEILLSSLSPELKDEEFVFCTFSDGDYGDHKHLQPVASFMETEGLTLVISKNNAQQENLSFDTVFKMITLNIHSSLDAVGLTAAISAKLTEYGISANVIAAYYHDHIFVPSEQADAAIDALNEFKDRTC